MASIVCANLFAKVFGGDADNKKRSFEGRIVWFGFFGMHVNLVLLKTILRRKEGFAWRVDAGADVQFVQAPGGSEWRRRQEA